MLRFPSKPADEDARPSSIARGRAGRVKSVFALLVILALAWVVSQSAAQQETEPEAPVQAAPGGTAATLEETLKGIDDLLDRFDTRIEGVRARAEALLDQADAAGDPDEQMRLEELYGRMMATAQGWEEQRSKLRQMRDELATSIDATAP